MFSPTLCNSTGLCPCVTGIHNPSRREQYAGIMVRSRDTIALTAEQSSPGTRRRRHSVEHSRKRPKFLSSETETRTQIQTLKSNFTRASSSCTSQHTNSYGWKQNKGRRKSRRTLCQRKWTYSARDASKHNDRVVIVSYNILGVENATKHPELYSRVSPEYMDWEYRKKVLCKEIRGYQPSILCFQEVDHFDDLNKLLQKDGFRGLHKARSGDSRDGCAIFWKSDLFTLLDEENIEFQRFGLRHNVAQFCVLKMNQNLHKADDTSSASTSRSIVVGNIHVLYNPKRGDVKLGQMRMFLEKAYELSQKWGCIPVVVTGDFNSLPQSALYQYVASSKLHIQHHDPRQISGQIYSSGYTKSYYLHNRIARWTDEEKRLATGSRDNNLKHPLVLRSAYAGVPGSSKVRGKAGEPLATSYHSSFSGTVDYIWHTLDLVPVKVLEALPTPSLKMTGGLPSKVCHFPSYSCCILIYKMFSPPFPLYEAM
ncbi:carbon catabolite repressor protein 4 homolog 5 isoform X1 [Salvia miltiorrhiza]|uniref:carbon catabolite repressor protein 4 homolog 5 isoform X1 n=1 Tax=Salvia miltiorrhiza TaxID=226208 RepID=UPI0025AD803E|nr:carbon catabolite repressor protein 4 homolog 5 isoform X1 [Salvia miltiorrhiza]